MPIGMARTQNERTDPLADVKCTGSGLTVADGRGGCFRIRALTTPMRALDLTLVRSFARRSSARIHCPPAASSQTHPIKLSASLHPRPAQRRQHSTSLLAAHAAPIMLAILQQQLPRGSLLRVVRTSSSLQLHSQLAMRSIHSVAPSLSRTSLMRPAAAATTAAGASVQSARPWVATLTPSRSFAAAVRKPIPGPVNPPLHMWSAQPHAGGYVISSNATGTGSAGKKGSAASPNHPVLIYSTQLTSVMRGAGYVVLLLLVPTVLYTWPILWESFEHWRAGASFGVADGSIDSRLLLIVNAGLAASIAALTVFNRRLVHTVHLYPRTRTLAIRTLHTVGSNKQPLFVPLDAVQPPMVHSGIVAQVRTKLHVADAPRIDSAPVDARAAARSHDVWSSVVNPDAAAADPASASSSSSSSSSIRPAQSFYIFPFPNGALNVDGLPHEEPNTVAAFSRLLSTGMHSPNDLEQLARAHERSH